MNGDLIYQAMLDSMVEQVAALDLQGNVFAVNNSWVKFALDNGGGSADAPPFQNYLKVCETSVGENATEARPVADGLRGVLDGILPSFQLEYPCHSPKEKRWFLMSITPLLDGREIVGAVISHLPITKRKLAEERLKESEENLRVAQRLAHIGSFRHDIKTSTTTWSEELFQITGMEGMQDAPSMKSLVSLIHPDDRKEVTELFDLSRLHGKGFSTEFRIVAEHLEEKFVSLICECESDGKSPPVGYYGALIDITSRHEAELQLKLLATTDPLTGVSNRRSFMNNIETEFM